MENLIKYLMEKLGVNEEQARALASELFMEVIKSGNITEIEPKEEEEEKKYIIEPEQIGDFWKSKIISKYPVEELRLEIQQVITDATGKKYFKSIEGLQDLIPSSIDRSFLEEYLPDGTYQILLRAPDGKLMGRQIIQIKKHIPSETKISSTEELLKQILMRMEQRDNLLLSILKQKTEQPPLSLKEIVSLIKETQPKLDLSTIYTEIIRTIKEIQKSDMELQKMKIEKEEITMYPHIEPPEPPPNEVRGYEILKKIIESELIKKIIPEQYQEIASKFINKEQVITILKSIFEENALYLLSQEELEYEMQRNYYNGYLQGFRDGQIGKSSIKSQT